MFSLPKLLTLALIILVVWYGFKWISRVNRLRAEQARPVGRRAPGAAAPGKGSRAEEMEKCRVCGVYVAPASAAACGRPDCPF
ncbi:hypothetical protein [Arenibaculum sp.]|jgi:uncharacterized protein|uniref:hypothetical protein n=1 Tax=Arenibaculum sp. TaxID=2865862 RepID=UPI002E156A17|nr:hypothetical protein [Arenibaculum sp.]